MRHAVFALGFLAASAGASASAAPPVTAQGEGGGIGGSLVDPASGARPVAPHPGRATGSRGAPDPRAGPGREAGSAPAIYSYPIDTRPDGWAALKAEPRLDSRRLTKVYDGTPFLVVGQVPGWKLVQLRSGERGWVAERLVGCCRPASR